MPNFETVEVTTDILICGGGMSACGAAVEASYWASKNGLKVTLVDKAAVDRSGGSVRFEVPMFSLLALQVETFEPSKLPPDLAAIPAVKPGSK